MLALLIVGSFALLTFTYSRGSDGLQRGVSTIFSPLQEVGDRALKPARDLVNWFDQTFEARGRNSRLQEELRVVRKEAVDAKAAMNENRQMRAMLGLDRSVVPSGYEPVTGRVIARSPTVWFAAVTIDVGSSEGVSVDDPVIDGDGLIGKVAAVTPGTSQVTLIADHSSAVTAKIVPGGAQGVVKPEVGDPGDLILDFLNSTKSIHRGETVVTAGWRAGEISSEFPPNIPIGEVTRASLPEQEATEQVHVRPFADLPNIDMVQVLTGGSRG